MRSSAGEITEDPRWAVEDIGSNVGAKTALLAFSDGELRAALRGATRSELTETEELVRRVHPGFDVQPDEDSNLSDGVYPPDDVTYATALADVEIVCDRRFALASPSELPAHLLAAAAGRRIILHAMHSAVDWLAFAVWENGELVRSLSLAPDGGIRENIGDPYDFELPYWAGEHPVEPWPGWPADRPYPLPFHPLDLGEAALRELVGFVVEGRRAPDDVDADSVHLHGFRVTDPSGVERAVRDAQLAEMLRRMGPPRRFRLGPDGTMREA